MDHEFIIDGVLLTLVSLFGLIGTLMAICVLCGKEIRKSPFFALLIGLASCDAGFLASAILGIGLKNCSMWYRANISTRLLPITHGLLCVFRTGSVYLTMSVTVERYFAIVRPLAGRANLLLLPASLIFAVVYNIPRFFELKQDVFEITNETVWVPTDMRMSPLYVSYYNFWAKVVFLELIPYFTIIFLNTLIVRQIVKSRRFRRSFKNKKASNSSAAGKNDEFHELIRLAGEEREKAVSTPAAAAASTPEDDKKPAGNDEIETISAATTPGSSHAVVRFSSDAAEAKTQTERRKKEEQELNLAATLLGISLLFIVCQSLKIIPDVYEMVTCFRDQEGHPSGGGCSDTPIFPTFIDSIISVSNLLSCFNSSANFLVYMLRGKKFREAFFDQYALCLKRNSAANAEDGGRQQSRISRGYRRELTETALTQKMSLSPSVEFE